jgi:hypothetical protein
MKFSRSYRIAILTKKQAGHPKWLPGLRLLHTAHRFIAGVAAPVPPAPSFPPNLPPPEERRSRWKQKLPAAPKR